MIAERIETWREVIDGSVDCRFTWTFGETPLDTANGTTCYYQEQTMVATANTAVRDLDALKIPASMETIVSETTPLLSAIAEYDLTGICGTGAEPAETPECTEMLGSLNFFYTPLKSKLDAWGPWL